MTPLDRMAIASISIMSAVVMVLAVFIASAVWKLVGMLEEIRDMLVLIVDSTSETPKARPGD